VFAVGAASDSEKVIAILFIRVPLPHRFVFALAGNEYGSFQLVIIPFWTDLKDVTYLSAD